MKRMRSYFLFMGVFAAAALLLAGSYKFVDTRYARVLEEKAHTALAGGNYLAALGDYSVLKSADAPDEVPAHVDAKILESKNLLVAEEVFLRAEKARESGDWFAVKALLQNGDAVTNASFKEREAAVALLGEATDKVRGLEEKIEAELAKFREDAAEEKTLRENAEEKTEAVEKKIANVEEKLETTLREKDRERERAAAELAARTAEKIQAEQAALRERLLKFLNELDLHASVFTYANGYFDDAIAEIEKGKSISAYSFLSRAEDTLAPMDARIEDLLNNRTEEQYKDEVRILVQSVALFRVASNGLGSAAFYAGKSGDDATAKFNQYMSEGKGAKNEALRLMNTVKDFAASLR
ncbi:MAG: hypothetical protein A3D67_00755 [Candidatus Lloydbacteria bacterium RIFCSPHIGHO2_02_FULL_51_22]|uniref:Uncharacterized protein n=3 Tax=Candidatus Lloydiibacteriota TaxID=1817910 RepID=A0A1G2DG58_9BACT|nr:MAG: hypothetical protein A3D67_00755 [Candidatus Lloydbacteria bacterium RIFCSPHIGHO2_02_FULL_51_22]OGZ15892.1 MAG: hypothetical protein A3J08_04625 [Candidatus Lloydbacteria bacterium RIFCSPLOWO2_02_FULL_51_11]OGZ16666.1 MAG: hypothetical protein A3G11_02980 [Candidatus Lloydbacteria bacterium RIFCSPLOWO2_12_FULL_51_9]